MTAPCLCARFHIILALLLMGAAVFASLLAVGSPWVLCQSRDCGSLADFQTFTGLAGLVPAGLMLFKTCQGRYQAAWRWLGVALVIYAGWAILNDALTHGWHDLRISGWLGM